MKKKTAGIVTLYSSQNFGAFLQSFAMQTVLEDLGYQVEFLRYMGTSFQELFFMVKTKNIKLALFRLRQFLKYFKSRHFLHIANDLYSGEELDVAIVGSDTLWDVQNPTIRPSEYYLGRNLNAKKIVAYAPSANGTSANEFCEKYGKNNLFDKFYLIGVRDNNTANLVAEISGSKPNVVLDPTLLLHRQQYPVIRPKINEKYVLVYGYSFKKEEQMVIASYANKIGAKIISVGLLNSWCDKNVVVTVPEFLGYIVSAECIFTTTFHGTIFSVIMEKQFVTFARSNYKVIDLLEKLSLNSRNASKNIYETEKIAGTRVDYDEVKMHIEAQRKESMQFLKESLV